MHDVVIVGAGPVGLFLACELGLAGCSVLVLEREPGPQSPLKAAPLGVRGLFGASTAAFHRRGLLRQLLSASGVSDEPGTDSGAPAPSPLRGAGHFAGMVLDPARVDVDALPYWLPSAAPRSLRTHLEAVETVLAERAAELGVDVRYGAAVTDVTQNEEGVVAHADGHPYPARWLVGCDGGRSAVRKLAGFAFEGTEPEFTGYLAQVTIADPEKLGVGFNPTPQGMYLRIMPGYLALMDFDGGAFDRSRQPALDHLQSVLRRVAGTDATLSEVQLATSFTDRAMQATTYRQGRVLLAGDAAHIHSPLGGQGLNLGLGDAMNLGWKLAATVHGHAPDGLLDTYTRERHPVGAAVLDWSRAQVAVMRPGPYAQAVQGVVRDLIGTRDGTTYVFERMSGSWIRYDLGDEHPLVGRDAPDFQLEDGTRLSDLMADGHGVVLDFGTEQSLRPAAKGRESRLRYVAGAARDDLGLGAVLVRPDGVVVWADGRTPDRPAFEAALARWFGPLEH
ncbi:FAD-dependent oxidoreductase [Streptomyces sp. ASQP_92]|uniref:FAD-dependent monooxygenase n=1 Tax=Streptomyces sp. ASQP_92 TaxID=2979116 RepID=UPI0021BEC801|nr:FAD-dependent monooxygenase [Streptomyces sp. ASQP_92]MCT9088734.1 FAD-dependent oxidoreductase [Streptomyces sp. ASQP_92]